MNTTQREIILEALQDYKKWFEDDPANQQDIDSVINFLNSKHSSDSNEDSGFFPIKSVSKEDIIQVFDGETKVRKVVMNLEDHDMKFLASKLADDYCNQLFWDSLKIIFEFHFLENKGGGIVKPQDVA